MSVISLSSEDEDDDCKIVERDEEDNLEQTHQIFIVGYQPEDYVAIESDSDEILPDLRSSPLLTLCKNNSQDDVDEVDPLYNEEEEFHPDNSAGWEGAVDPAFTEIQLPVEIAQNISVQASGEMCRSIVEKQAVYRPEMVVSGNILEESANYPRLTEPRISEGNGNQPELLNNTNKEPTQQIPGMSQIHLLAERLAEMLTKIHIQNKSSVEVINKAPTTQNLSDIETTILQVSRETYPIGSRSERKQSSPKAKVRKNMSKFLKNTKRWKKRRGNIPKVMSSKLGLQVYPEIAASSNSETVILEVSHLPSVLNNELESEEFNQINSKHKTKKSVRKKCAQVSNTDLGLIALPVKTDVSLLDPSTLKVSHPTSFDEVQTEVFNQTKSKPERKKPGRKKGWRKFSQVTNSNLDAHISSKKPSQSLSNSLSRTLDESVPKYLIENQIEAQSSSHVYSNPVKQKPGRKKGWKKCPQVTNLDLGSQTLSATSDLSNSKASQRTQTTMSPISKSPEQNKFYNEPASTPLSNQVKGSAFSQVNSKPERKKPGRKKGWQKKTSQALDVNSTEDTSSLNVSNVSVKKQRPRKNISHVKSVKATNQKETFENLKLSATLGKENHESLIYYDKMQHMAHPGEDTINSQSCTPFPLSPENQGLVNNKLKITTDKTSGVMSVSVVLPITNNIDDRLLHNFGGTVATQPLECNQIPFLPNETRRPSKIAEKESSLLFKTQMVEEGNIPANPSIEKQVMEELRGIKEQRKTLPKHNSMISSVADLSQINPKVSEIFTSTSLSSREEQRELVFIDPQLDGVNLNINDPRGNLNLLTIGGKPSLKTEKPSDIFAEPVSQSTGTLPFENTASLYSSDIDRLRCDFVKYYGMVFDDSSEYSCMKMGDLLHLTVKEARDYKSRMMTANKFTCEQVKSKEVIEAFKYFQNTLKTYRDSFTALFGDLYKKIYTYEIFAEQFRALLTAWFLKLFLRVTTLAPELSDSLHEAKFNVIYLLPKEILNLSLVKAVLLCNETVFERNCWLILDFMQKCFDSNGETKCQEIETTNVEITNKALPMDSSESQWATNIQPTEHSSHGEISSRKNEGTVHTSDVNLPSNLDEGLSSRLTKLSENCAMEVSVIVKDSNKCNDLNLTMLSNELNYDTNKSVDQQCSEAHHITGQPVPQSVIQYMSREYSEPVQHKQFTETPVPDALAQDKLNQSRLEFERKIAMENCSALASSSQTNNPIQQFDTTIRPFNSYLKQQPVIRSVAPQSVIQHIATEYSETRQHKPSITTAVPDTLARDKFRQSSLEFERASDMKNRNVLALSSQRNERTQSNNESLCFLNTNFQERPVIEQSNSVNKYIQKAKRKHLDFEKHSHKIQKTGVMENMYNSDIQQEQPGKEILSRYLSTTTHHPVSSIKPPPPPYSSITFRNSTQPANQPQKGNELLHEDRERCITKVYLRPDYNDKNACPNNPQGSNRYITPVPYHTQQNNPPTYSYPFNHYHRYPTPSAVSQGFKPQFVHPNMYIPPTINQYSQQAHCAPHVNTPNYISVNAQYEQPNQPGCVASELQGNVEQNTNFHNVSSLASPATINVSHHVFSNNNTRSVNTIVESSFNCETPNKSVHDIQSNAGVIINNYNITSYLPANLTDQLKHMNNECNNYYNKTNSIIEPANLTCNTNSTVPEVLAKETLHWRPPIQNRHF